MDSTWSGRLDRWCPYAFAAATAAAAIWFAGAVAGWTLDPLAITILVAPLAAAAWVVLMVILFVPAVFAAVLVAACLDAIRSAASSTPAPRRRAGPSR